MNDLLMTFYGDDFTGSTDALEALVLGGVPAVLFLEPPDADFVAEHFPHVRALGVAGVSRSMTPAQMDEELPPIFGALAELNAPLFHYKVCSTFDSAPHIGSIGHAIEQGLRSFGAEQVPLVVGAPALKRYVAFGNLFATVGDETYRIDRHPTMKQHPITPMDEGDLRLHLRRQTARRIGLIDLRHLSSPAALTRRFEQLVAEGTEIFLFDTTTDDHLLTIGEQVWSMRGEKPVMVVGSSGVEYAMTAYWQDASVVQAPDAMPSPGAVDKIAAISGSASPVTAEQMQRAIDSGFHPVRLNSAALIDPDSADAARNDALSQAVTALEADRSVILFSTMGPDDPAIDATKARMTELHINPHEISARLGKQQGILLRELLAQTGLQRVCVAGGDTCGHAARQLDLYALEYLMPTAPGAPLCKARSHNPAFDGLEISLKGGQLGGQDYFATILNG